VNPELLATSFRDFQDDVSVHISRYKFEINKLEFLKNILLYLNCSHSKTIFEFKNGFTVLYYINKLMCFFSNILLSSLKN